MLQSKKDEMLVLKSHSRLQNVKWYIPCVQIDVSEYDPTPGCIVRNT